MSLNDTLKIKYGAWNYLSEWERRVGSVWLLGALKGYSLCLDRELFISSEWKTMFSGNFSLCTCTGNSINILSQSLLYFISCFSSEVALGDSFSFFFGSVTAEQHASICLALWVLNMDLNFLRNEAMRSAVTINTQYLSSVGGQEHHGLFSLKLALQMVLLPHKGSLNKNARYSQFIKKTLLACFVKFQGHILFKLCNKYLRIEKETS